MKKAINFTITAAASLLILFTLTSRCNASFKNDLKKAANHIELKQYKQAVPLLERAVLENLFNSEVHFMLGVSYLNIGNLYGAGEVFRLTSNLTENYNEAISKEYKKVADNALRKDNIPSSVDFFEQALKFNPGISRQERYSFFLALGDKTGKKEYYARGLAYADGDTNKKNKIDKIINTPLIRRKSDSRYLHINTESNELRASKALLTAEPSYSIETILKKSFTFNDAYENKYGQIKALRYGNDNIRIGDRIEITTQLKNGAKFKGKEIGIWNGSKDNPKWIKTENGYYSETVRETRKNNFIISLSKRKDIKVILTVNRKMPFTSDNSGNYTNEE